MRSRRSRLHVGAGLAAALLASAALGTARVGAAEQDGAGTQVAQGEKRPGFGGFPQWDGKFGQPSGRFRTPDEQDRDKDKGDQKRMGFGGGFGKGGFGKGGFGGGFGPGGQPAKEDYAKWMELAKQLYEKMNQEKAGPKGEFGPTKGKGKGEFGPWMGKGKGKGGFGSPMGKGKGKGGPEAGKGQADDYAKWMALAKQLYEKFQMEKGGPKGGGPGKEMKKGPGPGKEMKKGPPWAEMAKKQSEKGRPWAQESRKAAPKGSPMARWGQQFSRRPDDRWRHGGMQHHAAGRFGMGHFGGFGGHHMAFGHHRSGFGKMGGGAGRVPPRFRASWLPRPRPHRLRRPSHGLQRRARQQSRPRLHGVPWPRSWDAAPRLATLDAPHRLWRPRRSRHDAPHGWHEPRRLGLARRLSRLPELGPRLRPRRLWSRLHVLRWSWPLRRPVVGLLVAFRAPALFDAELQPTLVIRGRAGLPCAVLPLNCPAVVRGPKTRDRRRDLSPARLLFSRS